MLRGDCSIRTEGCGFTAEEIAACAERQGLLSLELRISDLPLCNCPACAISSPQAPLSLDEIQTLLEQAMTLGCRKIILIPDNPTLLLDGVIECCREQQYAIEIFIEDSNLTPRLAAKCRSAGARLSIELKESAQLGLLESLAASNLAVRIAATSKNLAEIPRVWRWARSHGIEPHIQIITPRGSADEDATVIPATHARELFEQLGRIDREEFNRIWTVPPSLIGRSCKRHLYACHVTPCGTIFACVGLTIPLGNVRTESLRDILVLSEVLENIRGFGGKVKEPCRTCSKSTDCYGCRGAAYQLTGDYLAGDSLCWKASDSKIESLPADAGAYIPHGPSIRMIGRLTDLGERTSRVDFTVPSHSLWTDDSGILDEVAYIEMIAQAFAATHGFHRWAYETADQQGLLLGIKDLRITGQARIGQRLIVQLKKVARFGDFGLVEGDIRHEDGAPVATGQIKVWRPNEELAKAMIP